jgi:hypothetical protein
MALTVSGEFNCAAVAEVLRDLFGSEYDVPYRCGTALRIPTDEPVQPVPRLVKVETFIAHLRRPRIGLQRRLGRRGAHCLERIAANDPHEQTVRPG